MRGRPPACRTPLRSHVDKRAPQPPDREVEVERVKHARAILAGEVEQLPGAAEQLEEVPVRDHDALRAPGRADV
jgi:hypothetical protein